MTPMAQFWLDRHDYFRSQCLALHTATHGYRERSGTPAEFGRSVTPRMQEFLSHLNGHHQIEDHHYFPAFRAADLRLAHGFDVLARDHKLLHEGIGTIIETANAFIKTFTKPGQKTSGEQRPAGDRFVDASELLCRRVVRHLEDEEDLIIPLMLAQSERATPNL